MTHPRYMGIPTFMRQKFADNAEGLDIALAGVPYDGGVSNRPGARHGPREIRNASSLTRAIHHVTKINPFELCAVADVGDVMFSQVYDVEASMAEIEAFFSAIVKAGAAPLTAGGDHSISYPILKALGAERPLHIVHIDAHTDTWDTFQGSKFHHGAPFRRAVEAGVIDPTSMIQIGIRGAQNVTEGWDFSIENGMRVIFMEEFTAMGVEAVIAEARRVVGDGPVYVSFDVDGLDPVYAPGTGTPEIGGLTTIEGQALVRGLRGLNIVGGDVVEVSPPFDPTGNTAMVGATLMYEILCILAESVANN
jgi:guanidinopropionase